jgi:PTS system nitrogen regulatory IIA component
MAMEHLTVRETAKFLKVSEKTVYRWIRQGVIPTFKFQGQYRFDRNELEAWARYKRIGGGAPAPAVTDGEEEEVELLEALRRGGIHYKIEGVSPEEIYPNLVELLPFGPETLETTKEALVNDLVEREAMVTTGIGKGVALPHPRHPRDWGLGAPAVAIFFLDKPVDFHAFDGEPVFVLFLVLCRTIKGHLRMLSLVSHLLNNPEMHAYLRSAPTRTELMEAIHHGLVQRAPAKKTG